MIDQQTALRGSAAVSPMGPRTGRFLVLSVVFVCAACGLVYELELVAMATYLIGDSVTQASVVLSVMVFAMGIGSLLAKRLRGRAVVCFGLLEAVLALTGGASALVLYASFAWLGESRHVLVAFSLAIGVLIGAEIPLLMTLIQRVDRQDAGGAVADLFAADYVGALVGGLAFPFLLLPTMGQLTGALVTGAVNAAAGGALVLWAFRGDLDPRSRRLLLVVDTVVVAALASGTFLVDDFERSARRAVYGEDVRVAVRTEVQEVVLTGAGRGPLGLYLDGRLRVSSDDGHRFHEALVHPAMAGRHGRVLVLGGGDGLAAREVLRYPDVESVVVVERDAQLTRLARRDPALSALNGHAYDDPRLTAVARDAFGWLRAGDRRFDVVISDLPAPGISDSTKLYSAEFYGLVAGSLAPGGRLVVHAGPPGTGAGDFWTVEASVRAGGLVTRPYRVGDRPAGGPGGPDGPARPEYGGGEPPGRGFVLAARRGEAGRLRLGPRIPEPMSLDERGLLEAGRAAERSRPGTVPPSTLVHPRY
ncbi:polyamine aminopropyltransferase [Streptomyces nitrosporeus]|uniref:Polyamine aminopropyltransferase n=1 Tax=Streptomyces nitrosporeus TaxID=28894 RepID=A0A5J6FBL4_9ACTN|nr:polyamine aminopropyltransferase [Streptomyces nitrosporeus]QEU73662.1 polyamine aminopropyltransferase [Streptomyces nitrosporeus]GGZ12177.1 polyamine aminopropyltransferase 2 [Streptomyces nitrosporeus]